MPDVHARYFTASASSRWLNCLGSVLATADKPNTAGKDAAIGTFNHLLCAFKLDVEFNGLNGDSRDARLDEIVTDPLYDEEHKEAEKNSADYLEYVKGIVYSYAEPPIVMVEQRVDYSGYADAGFGTADCIVLAGTDMHIVDYKNGKGVPVSSEDNSQLKLYALGALSMFESFYDIDRVVLHIVQPRIDNTSSWETSAAALRKWGEETVIPAAKAAMEPDAPFTPGVKQCRWCPIKATCRARAMQQLTLPGAGKKGAELTNEEIAAAIRLGEDVASWYSDIKEFAAAELLSGKEIPGFKLVAGRSTRAWADQRAAFDALQERGVAQELLYERTPITAAKLEKALGKKTFADVAKDLVASTPGKPTMVPEDDKRKAYSPVETMFKKEN